MLVEIAICTWNRSRLLEATLKSCQSLIIPHGVDWRILLVDNNSSDNTQDLIQHFKDQLPIEPLFEDQQGHTFARNRAVRAAAGELILWTDDDCHLNPSWLENYVEASTDHNFDFWGSAIIPRFVDEPAPEWLSQNWEICKGCFAERDLGESKVEFSSERLPYGANFAVRTEVQKKRLFNTKLGRQGDEVVGEDELDLMRDLLTNGHRGCWVPGNSVDHLIDKDRSSLKYVYNYFRGQGRANTSPDGNSKNKLRRRAFWQWLMFRIKRRFTDSNTWLSHMIDSALAQGQIESLDSS